MRERQRVDLEVAADLVEVLRLGRSPSILGEAPAGCPSIAERGGSPRSGELGRIEAACRRR